MTPSVIRIMTRITEIQKRFGLIKNSNQPKQETAVKINDTVEISNKRYTRSEIDNIINNVSKEESIPSNLIKSIVENESSYDQYAVSNKGAIGLMQIMPNLAEASQVENIYDPYENVKTGTEYMSYLLKKYDNNYNLALAAYNAGETAVDKYNGIPPYKETEEYVSKVLDTFYKMK